MTVNVVWNSKGADSKGPISAKLIRVLGTEDGFDAEVLPMFLLELADGTRAEAFPDEISSPRRAPPADADAPTIRWEPVGKAWVTDTEVGRFLVERTSKGSRTWRVRHNGTEVKTGIAGSADAMTAAQLLIAKAPRGVPSDELETGRYALVDSGRAFPIALVGQVFSKTFTSPEVPNTFIPKSYVRAVLGTYEEAERAYSGFSEEIKRQWPTIERAMGLAAAAASRVTWLRSQSREQAWKAAEERAKVIVASRPLR